MVLVEKSNLPVETLAYLNDLKPTDITIVGGVGSVNAQVKEQLQDLFPAAYFRRFPGNIQSNIQSNIHNFGLAAASNGWMDLLSEQSEQFSII